MSKVTNRIVNRKFWTVSLKPCEPKVLGKHLPAGVMIMHNHGPGGIHVETGYTNVDAILAPGDTDVIVVRDHIGLAIIGDFTKPATLEFEFMLVPK